MANSQPDIAERHPDKRWRFLISISLLIALPVFTFAQAPVTDDDFQIFLLIAGMMFMAGMLACIGFGMILAIVISALVVFGISIGVITASAYIGFKKRSLSKGVNMLIMLSASICGLPIGIVTAVLLNKVYSFTSNPSAFTIGAVAGLCGGFVLGIAIKQILRLVTKYLDNTILKSYK